MKKLLLTSSHQITAFGLELLLKSKNLEIDIQTVCNNKASLEKLVAEDFQVLVTILEPNTLELASEIMRINPLLRILAITSNINMTSIQRLYNAGLKGVVDITNPTGVILQAIEDVLAGQTFLEEKFKNFLLQSPSNASNLKTPFDGLTKREEEVIALMLKGKKMGEISNSLNLKPSTVSTFKTKIYEKLGVTSLLELKDVCTLQH